jgi:hypothetical protein
MLEHGCRIYYRSGTVYNYLPGQGDILRPQRHSQIAEISVHYHNIKGGDRGDMRFILVRVY